MYKIKNFLNNLMIGRYGLDQFGRFLTYQYLFLYFVTILFFRNTVIGYILNNVSFIFFGFGMYRFFSKKTFKRQQENTAYLTIVYKLRVIKNRYVNMWKYRKEYKYLKCPTCHKYLRVPKGKGKISITCPHCHSQFDKKS